MRSEAASATPAVPPVVRFAPSPTGRLHLGNIKAAVLNALFARRHGGRFVLRIDDTDAERSRPEHEAAILEDLRWLGLSWDGFARQSDRQALYDAAIARLRADGRLYPCYETPEELELKRNLQRASGRPPVYDRAALKLTDADRARLEGAGRRPHWRFLLQPGRVGFDDLVRGPESVDADSLSDPVLVREDGRPLYTLTSVVDDGDLGVTHVIRGEDHVSNTGVQVQLFEALGHPVPRFGHFALVVDADGAPLSKRAGSLTMAALRDQGIEPLAVVALLARLGSSLPVEPVATIAAAAEGFDLSAFGRAAARFEDRELQRLSAAVVHGMDADAAAARLGGGLDPALWEAVRGNLERFDDIRIWQAVVGEPLQPVIEDADFCARAAALLPDGAPGEETWQAWTAALKAETGRKGATLFRPLRLALTGREHGPEMKKLLPLLGRARAVGRLSGEFA